MEPQGSLQVQLVSSWRDAAGIPGYSYADCHLEKDSDGWYTVTFAESLGAFQPEKQVSIVAKLQGCKLYALEGDFAATSHNY